MGSDSRTGKVRTLRVLLIDFSPVIREGLTAILTKDRTIEVVGCAAEAQEALQMMRRATADGGSVDVVLTETRTLNVDGVAATRLIKEGFPEASVIVLTENHNDAHVIDAIHAGADGFMFLKDMSSQVLLESIHRVIDGGTQMKTTLLRTAVDALLLNGRRTLAERTTEAAHLTAREVDVLRLMGNGDSNKAIGEALGITLDTSKKHVRNVIEKLQARSRTHASIIAAQAGIVGPPIVALVEPEVRRSPGTRPIMRVSGGSF